MAKVGGAAALVTALCKHFEGLYLRPYLCSAGVPTIGYGATFYEDGTRVTLKDAPITKERAEQLLAFHLGRRFLPAALKLCPGANTPGRLAGLVDFAFNLGEGNLRASTLRRRVNEGDWEDVPVQHMRWNRAGGQILRGLTRRCQARADLV
jgi:lysozyme